MNSIKTLFIAGMLIATSFLLGQGFVDSFGLLQHSESFSDQFPSNECDWNETGEKLNVIANNNCELELDNASLNSINVKINRLPFMGSEQEFNSYTTDRQSIVFNESELGEYWTPGLTNSPIITFQDPNGNSKYIFNNESIVDAPTSLPEVRSELKDIDNDGRLETAYEDAGTLKIIDKEGNSESLATASIPSSNSKIAVADIDDDGLKEVIYPNVNDNNYMYQVDINDNSPTRITSTTGSESFAIIGYSDFNNDGDKEIVFQGTSQTIKWLEGGTVQSTGYSSIGSSQGLGLGLVADYNNTGTPRVPIVDGSNQLAMIDNQGNKEILTSGVAKTTLGAYDTRGDNRDEIFYRNTNGKLATYNFNGTTSLYTTSQGNTINGNRINSIGIGVPIRSYNYVYTDSFYLAEGQFNTEVGYEEVSAPTSSELRLYSNEQSSVVETLDLEPGSETDDFVVENNFTVDNSGSYELRLVIIGGSEGEQFVYSLEGFQESGNLSGVGTGSFESNVFRVSDSTSVTRVEFDGDQVQSMLNVPRQTAYVSVNGYDGSELVQSERFKLSNSLQFYDDVLTDSGINSYRFNVDFVSETGESSQFGGLSADGSTAVRVVSESVGKWVSNLLVALFIGMALLVVAVEL